MQMEMRVCGKVVTRMESAGASGSSEEIEERKLKDADGEDGVDGQEEYHYDWMSRGLFY